LPKCLDNIVEIMELVPLARIGYIFLATMTEATFCQAVIIFDPQGGAMAGSRSYEALEKRCSMLFQEKSTLETIIETIEDGFIETDLRGALPVSTRPSAISAVMRPRQSGGSPTVLI